MRLNTVYLLTVTLSVKKFIDFGQIFSVRVETFLVVTERAHTELYCTSSCLFDMRGGARYKGSGGGGR